jgi:hypothetical protein
MATGYQVHKRCIQEIADSNLDTIIMIIVVLSTLRQIFK